MWLTKGGVPFDVAFAVSRVEDRDVPLEAEGFAWSVILGEFEGGEFDWDNIRWVSRDGR